MKLRSPTSDITARFIVTDVNCIRYLHLQQKGEQVLVKGTAWGAQRLEDDNHAHYPSLHQLLAASLTQYL